MSARCARPAAWISSCWASGERGTSELSADLRFGTISPRTVLATVGRATAGRAAFVRQLAWRDWFAHMTLDHPDLADAPVQEGFRAIRWRRDDAGFDAWAAGRTGFPIVDAGMRQLLAEGWMHNRLRMIVASFLVKDLHIEWTRGARHFMRHLVDGDLASNQHGWHWTAGTGTDAAPYFRIFNPATQAAKFDPKGDYRRRWLWGWDGSDSKDARDYFDAVPRSWGMDPENGYPDEPIVDLAAGRQRAWLHENGLVQAEEAGEQGTRVRVRWTERQRDRYQTL